MVVATGLITAGPAAAQSHSSRPRKAAFSYTFNAPTSAAVVGGGLFVTNGGSNSVTEVSGSTGAFVAGISAKRYGLQHPSAIEAVGTDLFVTNSAGNSVTEFRASDLKHLRTIRRSKYGFSDPIALASYSQSPSAQDLFVLNGSGSLTEIAAATGKLIGTVSGPAFGFHAPTGLAVADGRVFVANSSSNTVTVFNAATRALVAVLSGLSYSFSTPIGVAFDGASVWVTNQSADSVTEISAATLQAVDVLVDTTNLPSVGPITFGDGYVFTVSPPGGSPMVSQIQISPGAPEVEWMMCNTNGPYIFNNPQAALVSGENLWIVNEGGNTLTEMDTDSGALIRTVSG
jgi:YVTN family beta-propeller protein